MALEFSYDLNEFAREVIWHAQPGYIVEGNERDLNYLLVFIMARGAPGAYEHARKAFGFTDEDFRRAIHFAKPGLFYPHKWEEWNERLGISPALPLPKREWL